MTANQQYHRLLAQLTAKTIGGPSPRSLPTKEIEGMLTSVNMSFPLVTLPERKLSIKLACAEACWILSGRRDVGYLLPHAPRYIQFSDDGKFLSGAYGPPFLDQVRYVIDILHKDVDTRQAVMTLWRPNPRDSRDIPCTVAIQFLIRGSMINTNVFMRSSDAWLGWPYDVFSFTMMTAYVALSVHRGVFGLGELRIFAGSQHLYDTDIQKAANVVTMGNDGINLTMSIYGLISPDHLMNCLSHISECPILYNTTHKMTPFFAKLWELAEQKK